MSYTYEIKPPDDPAILPHCKPTWVVIAYQPNDAKTPLSDRLCNPKGKVVDFKSFAVEDGEAEKKAKATKAKWEAEEAKMVAAAYAENPRPWEE